MNNPIPALDRFLEKIDKDPDSDCIVWTACKNSKGYGCFERTLAHRWIYSWSKGDIPKGTHIHHTCQRKECVRLSHLEPLSFREHAQEHAPDYCKWGHPLFGRNMRYRRDGRRVCRTCAGWKGREEQLVKRV